MSGHDTASAHELLDLHIGLSPNLPAPGAEVSRAGQSAQRRLDAMLDSMGFAEQRDVRRRRLRDALGLDDTHPLLAYIDGYGVRSPRRVAATNAWLALPGPQRSAIRARLAPTLSHWLQTGVPPGAVARVAELLEQVPPGARGGDLQGPALNAALGAHQRMAGNASADATLTRSLELIALLEGNLPRDRSTNLLSSEFGARLEQGTAGMNELLRGAATTGVPFVPASGQPMMLQAEAALVTNGLHGIHWSQDAILARAMAERPEQGKFGTGRDVWYAVRAAQAYLDPEGVPGRPDRAIVELPPGNSCELWRLDPDTSTLVSVGPADIMFVYIRAGKVHGYPRRRSNPTHAADTAALTTFPALPY